MPFGFAPERYKIVDATAGPVTTNGGVTSDYVSLKNAHSALIVLQFTQAVGHATSVQPQKATAVAPTGATSITTAVPIWLNEDTAASDTLVRKTDATVQAVAATVKKKLMVIFIDPAMLGDTYDVLGFTVSDSSQATNFVCGSFWLEMRIASDQPQAVITD